MDISFIIRVHVHVTNEMAPVAWNPQESGITHVRVLVTKQIMPVRGVHMNPPNPPEPPQ